MLATLTLLGAEPWLSSEPRQLPVLVTLHLLHSAETWLQPWSP